MVSLAGRVDCNLQGLLDDLVRRNICSRARQIAQPWGSSAQL